MKGFIRPNSRVTRKSSRRSPLKRGQTTLSQDTRYRLHAGSPFTGQSGLCSLPDSRVTPEHPRRSPLKRGQTTLSQNARYRLRAGSPFSGQSGLSPFQRTPGGGAGDRLKVCLNVVRPIHLQRALSSSPQSALRTRARTHRYRAPRTRASDTPPAPMAHKQHPRHSEPAPRAKP
jgi:hypothetical protein